MSIWREITIVVIASSLSLSSEILPCQDERVFFVEQPTDVEVIYGEKVAAIFPCKYRGSLVRPEWIINSSRYSSINSDLPPGHLYRNYSLVVRNISVNHNNTLYRCRVLVSNEGSPCVYESAVGKLIVKSKVFQMSVACSSHYHFKSYNKPDSLTGISTVITKANGFNVTYTVTYSDSVSGANCDEIKISASFCNDSEMVCKDEFNVSTSNCSKTLAINVTVSAIDPEFGLSIKSEPIKIEGVNNFVEVSFEKPPPKINLNFINQPKQGEIFYSVSYGPLIQGCKQLPSQTQGNLLNLNSLSLELNVLENISFCFIVVANDRDKFVSVEGIFNIGSIESDDTRRSSSNFIIAVVIASILSLCLCGILCTVILLYYSIHIKRKRTTSKCLDQNEGVQVENEADGVLREHHTNKDKQGLLDKSTTYFELRDVPDECLMCEFAENEFSHLDYQPEEGFGYFKRANNKLESISRHKKLILMDEKVPKYVVLGSTMKDLKLTNSTETWTDIYEQNRSYTMTLSKGASFLYCARSKDITTTSFWQTYDVTEDCQQSDFAEKKVQRYTAEWIRYCYFEFTKSEYIKPHQRIIVLKKDSSLITGPGVRHLVGAVGDGSKMTPAPNFNDHGDWEHVFIQSRKVSRVLTKGSKFLFCAMMDRVRAHHSIYDIKEKCNMAVFGKQHVPGFKPELGYGYYEFRGEEFYKPHKKIILVHESEKLYTGSGAQFICTGVEHNKDVIMRKSKISPPLLSGTKWKHIFIQSHSKERELLPGTKFLYCEYKTYK